MPEIVMKSGQKPSDKFLILRRDGSKQPQDGFVALLQGDDDPGSDGSTDEDLVTTAMIMGSTVSFVIQKMQHDESMDKFARETDAVGYTRRYYPRNMVTFYYAEDIRSRFNDLTEKGVLQGWDYYG